LFPIIATIDMDIGYALAWYIVFIISVTFHEASHAWAAKRGGDLTAYEGGQVSMNPWPHIKRAPVGMFILPIISIFLIKWPFGFASTPYNPVWAYNHPRKAAWMAAAGPAANLLLLLISTAGIKVGVMTGFFLQPDTINFRTLVLPAAGGAASGLSIFISMLFSMNLILFILNLIPLPPLDGSGVVSLFLKEETARRYKTVISNPLFGLIGLLMAWYIFNPLFQVIFLKIINILYWGSNYS
jgi:Zn-dependent protease